MALARTGPGLAAPKRHDRRHSGKPGRQSHEEAARLSSPGFPVVFSVLDPTNHGCRAIPDGRAKAADEAGQPPSPARLTRLVARSFSPIQTVSLRESKGNAVRDGVPNSAAAPATVSGERRAFVPLGCPGKAARRGDPRARRPAVDEESRSGRGAPERPVPVPPASRRRVRRPHSRPKAAPAAYGWSRCGLSRSMSV